MPGGSRALLDRPNLRYLRLEAKRRLAAGEFATLHDAQAAIAREHGQPSWAALKQLVQTGPARTGLRGLPTGSRLRDPRTGQPVPQRTRGDVPAGVPALADQAFAELGLPALLLAGASPQNPEPWLLAGGWADLDRGEPLDPRHRFPAPGLRARSPVTTSRLKAGSSRLGWLISPRGDMAAHAGGGLDGTATLAIRIRDNRTHLVLTSRLIPVNSIDAAPRGAWTNPEE